MTDHLSLLAWSLLAFGAFSVGVSKTGVPGIGILNVAIFALVLPSAQHSVGVVLPILISADIIAVALYRRRAVWSHLWRLFPWAITGILIGFFSMPHLNDKQVAKLLGGILLALVLLTYVRKWSEKRVTAMREANAKKETLAQAEAVVAPTMQPESLDEQARHVSPLFTGIMGISGGFTTMVGNAAGPIMTLYLLAMKLPKMEFIGTGAWYFLLLNCFKVPFMMKLGWIDAPSLALSARLAPCAVLGAFAGRAIVPHIKQEWFEFTALALTVAAAIRLLWV